MREGCLRADRRGREGSELRDVEDIVYFPRGWEVKTIGHVTNAFYDFEGVVAFV